MQVEALRRVLQRTTEDWALFQNHLQDVTLLACRLRFSLQLQRAPVFSLKQAEEESDLLQVRHRTRRIRPGLEAAL